MAKEVRKSQPRHIIFNLFSIMLVSNLGVKFVSMTLIRSVDVRFFLSHSFLLNDGPGPDAVADAKHHHSALPPTSASSSMQLFDL
jgi:hypothetical protein